jgi:hypothetical protein
MSCHGAPKQEIELVHIDADFLGIGDKGLLDAKVG